MTASPSTADPSAAPAAMSSAAPPLRIAYVVDEYLNPENVTSWSGLPSFMFSALGKQAGVQLTTVVVRDRPREAWEWIKFLFHRFVFRTRYLRDRHGALLRSYGRQIERHLATSPTDLVFCPGSLLLAGLQNEHPGRLLGGRDLRRHARVLRLLLQPLQGEHPRRQPGGRGGHPPRGPGDLLLRMGRTERHQISRRRPGQSPRGCRSGPTCRRSRATRK